MLYLENFLNERNNIFGSGPVLMVQIENEYGSYQPADRNYTIWLRDLARQYLGDQVVFYTSKK